MEWAALKLWVEDEEKRILECICLALQQLIASKSVKPEDGELDISGKLRPYLYRSKKRIRLAWTLHSEPSSFQTEDAPKPFAHPDIRFSLNNPNDDQYDYDVECKLVRIKRTGKRWDYCQHYVTDGVDRYQSGKYAQSQPSKQKMPLAGTMIGYVQEGELPDLLERVNQTNCKNNLADLQLSDSFCPQDVTKLTQLIKPATGDLTLIHLWADLR